MAAGHEERAAVEAAANEPCRVCGNAEGNRLHRAREMFQGTRDEFDYVECATCGTLQIRSVPDLRPYYGEGYYSLRPAAEADEAGGASLKKRLSRLGEFRHPLGRLFARRAPSPASPLTSNARGEGDQATFYLQKV